MSNLKLPLMTRAAIMRNTFTNTKAQTRRIAFETTATLVDCYLEIHHHENLIAELGDGWLYITNAGWTSQTTRQRLHRILTDNTDNTFGLRQHRGQQVLFARGDHDIDVRHPGTGPLSDEFHSATLARIDGRWMLRTYNGTDTPAFETALEN